MKTKSKPKVDEKGRLFHFEFPFPYEQRIAIIAKDYGNGLPIGILCLNGDPYTETDVTMDVQGAKLVHKALGMAIEAAEKAGLK